MTEDNVLRALLGHLPSKQVRRGTIMLRLWDFDKGYRDNRGGINYAPHPQSGWYDAQKPIAVRTKGWVAIMPGAPMPPKRHR